MFESELEPWILGWAAVVLVVAFFSRVRRKFPSVGLPILYLSALSMSHWIGAMIYTIPGYPQDDFDLVFLGFKESFYGVVAFAAGNLVLAPLLIKFFQFSEKEKEAFIPNPRLPEVYILTGFIFGLVLAPFLGRIPSIRTLTYSGWALCIVGVCLCIWRSWQERKGTMIALWVLFAMTFPIVSVLFHAFLGYGTMALLIVLFFLASFFRPRWKLLATAVLLFYLGLSLFVTYMRDRAQIRELVWYENSTLVDRLSLLQDTFSDFEFFDINNQKHLARIDIRLNQNYFVGRAVDRMATGYNDFARGATLSDAMMSFVPRLVWPDKPYVAGSGDIVSQYTGLYFQEGTSVGAGQVFEFYINFGQWGIIFGFLILGVILTLFDVGAGDALIHGNYGRFIFWFLPGLGFLQAGGSLVEVMQTVTSSMVFCILINKYILQKYAGKKFGLHALWQQWRRQGL